MLLVSFLVWCTSIHSCEICYVESPKPKPCYAESGTKLKPMVPPLSNIEPQQQTVQATPSAPPLSGGKSPPMVERHLLLLLLCYIVVNQLGIHILAEQEYHHCCSCWLVVRGVAYSERYTCTSMGGHSHRRHVQSCDRGQDVVKRSSSVLGHYLRHYWRSRGVVDSFCTCAIN